MSKLSLRGWLKAVAVVSVRLANSPSTRNDFLNPSFLMEPIRLVLLAALTCLSAASSQDEKAATAPAIARIIGDLPDGTPPPPEPQKPRFIVPAQDILDTQIHQQGGRKIIVQKISPIDLPPPPLAAPPVDKTDPAFQARIAAFRANHPKNELIRIGANVYHSQVSAPRTLVTYWPNSDKPPVTLWSSADFSLLWGFASFVGSDGKTRSLMMTWSNLYTGSRPRLLARLGKPYIAPKIPDLPPGKATFVIVSGNLTVEALASIQSLHDLYNNEHDRLLTAYQDREQASLAREAELKANPPKPKDIVLNYWLSNSSEPSVKGGAR